MIECKNITKVYQAGGVQAAKVLKGVSFSVESGEFVAIIGPSGSGKSTLMHILGMLDTPTSGDYFLDGKNVAGYSDDDLAEIRKNKMVLCFNRLIFCRAPRFCAMFACRWFMRALKNPRAKRGRAPRWRGRGSARNIISTALTSFPAARCKEWRLLAPW
jgi:ABC-type antimicrobial peptide transport system, ATPase component